MGLDGFWVGLRFGLVLDRADCLPELDKAWCLPGLGRDGFLGMCWAGFAGPGW